VITPLTLSIQNHSRVKRPETEVFCVKSIDGIQQSLWFIQNGFPTAREIPPSVHNREYAATREQAMTDFKTRWVASISWVRCIQKEKTARRRSL